jgi:ABC-type dipeptide/oligopeptide/nickel transport system ATPase component
MVESLDMKGNEPPSTEKRCRLHPRCPFTREECRIKEPPLIEVEKGRLVKCWLYYAV